MKIFAPIILLISTIHGEARTIRGGGLKRELQQLPPTQLPPIQAVDDTYDIIQGTDLRERKPGILDNDSAYGARLFVSDVIKPGTFLGDLEVKNHGELRYSPPTFDFVGTERFDYTVCLEMVPTWCAQATVTINVLFDDNRPDAPPTARDSSYTIKEGEKLEVDAPGFLDNDLSGTPSNPLEECERHGKTEGHLRTHKDGSFEYTADKCWTGDDTFTYKACYEDYPDMESDWATVTITVQENRPDPPRPDNDRYEVFDGETLTVEAGGSTGLLWNDLGGPDIYVESIEEKDGFQGGVEWDEDGSFTYTSVAGQRGTFEFTYEVCNSEWDCVECKEGTATIEVVVNPDKPVNPPTPGAARYIITVGEVLVVDAPGFLDSATYDDRYTLVAANFETGDGFQGTLDNAESDGSFEYGNGPVGESSFTYTVCYEEWPDLCADGEVTIVTNAVVGDSSSRRGIATVYEVSWEGDVGTNGCETVEPSLSLSCAGDGELNLIAAGPSDNYICQNTTTAGGGPVQCAAKNAGTVFVECRDGVGTSDGNRQLIANLRSESVTCGGGTVSSAIHTTHQSMSLQTWCNEMWANGDIVCSGTILSDGYGGNPRCFDATVTLGTTANIPDVTMTSTAFEQCRALTFIVPEPPTLTYIGDADGDPNEPGYPLNECEADCDSDDECSGDLICFQRRGNEVVPGCVGTPEEGRDYCVRAPQPVTVLASRTGSDLLP